MPEERVPPTVPYVDLEAGPYDFEKKLIENDRALNLVNQTFDSYQTWRDAKQLPRWQNHDELFYGIVAQRYWPGKPRRKRSSLGIPLVFEQEESLLPALESNLFNQYPYWFSAEALEGLSTPAEAQALQARMVYWFETPREADGRITVDHLSLALQQTVHHGNGVVEIGWDADGYFCEWVDLRDIYVDPKLVSPWIDDSPAIIRTRTYTVQQLKEIRGLTLPPDAVLNHMAKSRNLTGGDYAREIADAFKQLGLGNLGGLSVDPAKQEIDVMLYWTPRRVIWVLGRAWVAFQGPNEYGFYPFCASQYIPSLSSWYSAGVSDFIEGEQRLTQGLTNANLDEVALSMDPPRVRRRGPFSHPSGLSWRPGMVDQVDRPKDDVVVSFPQGITQHALVHLQMAEARAQRRLGINDVGMGGAGVRPANTRTAAGVQLQNAGASNRQYMPLKRFERFMLTPLLYKTARLIAENDKDARVGLYAGPRGMAAGAVDPSALGKRVRFKLGAATRAASGDRLRASLPVILQTYLNGTFLQALVPTGRTVDFDQIDRAVQEATGTSGSYSFTRMQTPEEQQARQQPPPEAMMKMQADQQAQETRLKVEELKAQTAADKAAGQEAVEILKLLAEERNLDKELRAKALEAAVKLSKPEGGKGGGNK